MARVKAFLVLPVPALNLFVMSRGVGADELVGVAKLGGSLKQGGQVPLAVGKTVGKLKPVVRLDSFHLDAPAGIPLPQLLREVGGGVGGFFRVGGQEAQVGELVNGGILKQAELRVCNTPAWYYFHIHLDPLAEISHLFISFGSVCPFPLCRGKQPQFPHDTKQTLRAAGIAPLPQPVPQLHHAQVRIAAAHIPDQLQLCFCVLIGIAVRPSGLADQGLTRPVPPGLPEVDIRPSLAILPARAAHPVFFRIFH